MSESYENLVGAEGRDKLFRPKRYDAKQVFFGSPPLAWFEDEEMSLADISSNGAGCLDKSRDFDIAACGLQEEGVFRLTQNGQEIFSARGKRVRADETYFGGFVGIALTRAQFDLDKLARKNAAALALGPFEADEEDVPDTYRRFCADVSAFVGKYINRINAHLGAIEKDLSPEERASIGLELADHAAPAWRVLLERGNELVLEIHDDKKKRAAWKYYTECAVTPILLGGEGWSRSYRKPLGYPGDFMIMNYIYDGGAVGDKIEDIFLHELSLIGSRAIRSRMDKLSEIISAAVIDNAHDDVSLLSIGCGPARELGDVLELTPEAKTLHATLVDQDDAALEFAVLNSAEFNSSRLSVRALNISFKEMLNPSPLREHLQDKDVIYSSGLLDYINPLLARRFVSRVYQLLKPGGKLIVANLNNLQSGMIWPCEYVTDWTLYFRDEQEMRDLAADIGDAHVKVETDALGAIYFLTVTKPE